MSIQLNLNDLELIVIQSAISHIPATDIFEAVDHFYGDVLEEAGVGEALIGEALMSAYSKLIDYDVHVVNNPDIKVVKLYGDID